MKRRRRAAAAAGPVAGVCDVWLDTAPRKQSLVAKPKVSSRILEWKNSSVAFTQSRASQPCTKQTTISAFFCTQTDGKDKENSRPSPFIPKKACKDKGIPLAASSVKILALPRMEEARKRSSRAERERGPATPPRPVQGALASPTPLPDSSWLQAESHRSEVSCGMGEDSCCFSFTQDSEGNRVIAHRNESDLFMASGGSVTLDCTINEQAGQPHPEEAKTRLDFQPRPGAKQSKKPKQLNSVNSLIEFTEVETENVTTDSTGAAGLCYSPQRLAGARPLREHSWNAGAGPAEEGPGWKEGLSSPFRKLFTQDSEGHRVIAHRCQSIPSPLKDSNSPQQLPRSPYKGCASSAATRSMSRPGEQHSEVGYELLFTQDSEGNRVMKHCDLEWVTE